MRVSIGGFLASGNESYIDSVVKVSHYVTHIKLVLRYTMSSSTMPTPVRLPPDLKDWVKASAAANRRSVNAEILTLLELVKKQMEQAPVMN